MDALVLRDVVTGLVKSVMFGLVITTVGCQEGLRTGLGAEEVGRSTTSAVVKSIFLVVMVDLVFTALFYINAKPEWRCPTIPNSKRLHPTLIRAPPFPFAISTMPM